MVHQAGYRESLREALTSKLPPDEYHTYLAASEYHLHIWKYHRRCDFPSLRCIRRLLYQGGMLTVNRRGEWKIDRTPTFEKELGFDAVEFYKSQVRERFAFGTHAPSDRVTMVDVGPGNCKYVYESSLPGLLARGMGPEILFTIDGTLGNCMREDLRQADNSMQQGQYSFYLDTTLKTMEILSVAELVISGSSDEEALSTRIDDLFGSLQKLCGKGLATVSELAVINEGANAMASSLVSYKGRNAVGVGHAVAILIDELVARFRVPNGVECWWPRVCRTLGELARQYDLVRNTICNLGFSDTELKKDLDAVLESIVPERGVVAPGFRTVDGVQRLADALLTCAYSAAEKSDNGTPWNLLLWAGNELWRTVFFMEQTVALAGGIVDHTACVSTVLKWLRRPLAVVSPRTIQILYGWSDWRDWNEDLPRGFRVIHGLFDEPWESILPRMFEWRSGCDYVWFLRRLIERRRSIADARQRILTVSQDSAVAVEGCGVARNIIDMFAAWLYLPNNSGELAHIERDLGYAITLLKNATWLRGFSKTMLTTRQLRNLEHYEADPMSFLLRYFQLLEQGFEISEYVDVYPVEDFWFTSP